MRCKAGWAVLLSLLEATCCCCGRVAEAPVPPLDDEPAPPPPPSAFILLCFVCLIVEEFDSPSALVFNFLSFPAEDEDDDIGHWRVMWNDYGEGCKLAQLPGPAREGYLLP